MKILIIIGSTRPNRFSEKPASWIYSIAKKRKDLDVELVDLRDFPLPFFNEVSSIAYLGGKLSVDIAKKWGKKVQSADGFIIVSPEYNHGYSAVIKNALDYAYTEWNKKPVGFVGYGSVGGARAIEQLREVAIELQMAPIRNAIHIQWGVMLEAMKLTDKKEILESFSSLNDLAEQFLDQLAWWTQALKNARDND